MNDTPFSYRMGEAKVKCGMVGFDYYIHNDYDDRVISCWARGSKSYVESVAQSSVDNLNVRDKKARTENKHQKKQTMKYGYENQP